MQNDVKRCMVCGKPLESGPSICEVCESKIRGEALEKRATEVKRCRKEIKRYGGRLPTT